MNQVANIYKEIATQSDNSVGGISMNIRTTKKGQSMTEYLLIIAALAVTVMGGFSMVGQAGTSLVNQANTQLHASSNVASAQSA